jgi:competence ComEA-like helix-hairpin-helix protein
MNSKLWGVRSRIGNAFAFLILALLIVGGAGQAVAEDGKAPLDLNRATSAQLEALPGIGAVKAAAILAVRDARGGFETMDQLESVRGVGPALMNKLRPLVVLGAPTASKPASSAKSSSGLPSRSGK